MTAAAMTLSPEQVRRYARHILLPDVGGVGQARLLAARVTVPIGAGREAELVALTYLAAAGVGVLILSGDPGGPISASEAALGIPCVAADLGRPRIEALRERLAALNPDVRVIAGAAETVDAAARLDVAPAAADGSSGVAVADALFRGGVAAARLLHHIARPPTAEPCP